MIISTTVLLQLSPTIPTVLELCALAADRYSRRTSPLPQNPCSFEVTFVVVMEVVEL